MWNLKPTRISCNAAYQDGISSRPVLPGSRVYLKYRCWDDLGRVMIQRSIRLKGSACSQDYHGAGDRWITGHGGPWVLHAEEHFQMRIWWVFAARWRECRRQNRRQAQVQPVWFDSKNMKLSVFNQFGFILGWADSLPDVVDDLLAIPAENILRECQFWDFHTLLPTQRKC